MVNKTELKNTADIAINLLKEIKEDVSFLKIGATPQRLIDIIRDNTDNEVEFLNNNNCSDVPVQLATIKTYGYNTYEKYPNLVKEERKFSVMIEYDGYANKVLNLVVFKVDCTLDSDDITIITAHEIESVSIEYAENNNDTIARVEVSSK